MRTVIHLFAFGLLLHAGLGLSGCARLDATPADAPLPERSIYHLDASWTTQDEDIIQLADFRGQPAVVALIYAHCAYACPRLVHDMKVVAAEMGKPNVRYVLVTLDPERDTPAQLRTLKDGFGLDDRWTLLRGDSRDIRRLAALLGVQYRTEADGEISHSNLISVLDRGGELAHQQVGLGTDPTVTVATLRGLLAAR
jgi:protein SCO1